MADDFGGGFFGGAAEAMSNNRTQALAEQKQKSLDANEAKKTAISQIDATIKHINDVFKAAADAGNDPKAIIATVQPLADSAKGLAAAAGINPAMIDQTIGALAARPPVADNTKHQLVKVADPTGQDMVLQHEQSTGKITRIDPKTGQPILSPSEVITPAQVQAANPPAPQPAPQAPQAAIPPDAALPPGAAPTEAIDARFAEPAAPLPPPNPNINLAAIGHLPPAQQGLVKGAADGTVDPTKTWSLRKVKTPDGEMSERAYMLGQVKAYDDTFDMANPGARAKTLNAFKSGIEARKLSALGTVVGHVAELSEDGKKLDNWKSSTFGAGTKAMNNMRTWLKENEQSPIVNNFNLSATAVSNELETAFRGNTTAISGIQEWRKSINPGMASDEIQQSTQKLGKLLLARMGELKEQWDRGMGHNQDPSISFKLAKSRELLEKMSAGTLLSDRTVPGSPAAIANPTVDALKSKYGLD